MDERTIVPILSKFRRFSGYSSSSLKIKIEKLPKNVKTGKRQIHGN
jgi:hypothetical protein